MDLYHLPLPSPRSCTVSSTLPASSKSSSPSIVSSHLSSSIPWRTPFAHVQLVSKDFDDEPREQWIETAQLDDSFALDGPLVQDTTFKARHNHPRCNSLELDFGDLPPPSFLSSHLPSPALSTPSSFSYTSSSSSGHSYFPSASTTPSTELPPSPALVPLTLSPISAPPSPAPVPPAAKPSTMHPLHRAKRLSMTPLSCTRALPSPPPAKLALRRGSVVDLPSPALGPVDTGVPPTPPLTPELCARVVEKLDLDTPKGPPSSALATGRSTYFTDLDGAAKRQRFV
ncbi:hypothetical protein JCM10207_006934 [Rhodosporidiobolus poonsookiae]